MKVNPKSTVSRVLPAMNSMPYIDAGIMIKAKYFNPLLSEIKNFKNFI